MLDLDSLVSRGVAIKYRIFPEGINEEGKIDLLIDETKLNREVGVQLKHILDCNFVLRAVEPAEINERFKIHYRISEFEFGDQQSIGNIDPLNFDDLIREGLLLKASDIHIEPMDQNSRIRFRIDGKLLEKYTIRLSDHQGLVNRIKIKAQLDISERRLPQDGRITTELSGSTQDERISIIPTRKGEKVVIRILKKLEENKRLEDIGFSKSELKVYNEAILRTNGIILISGPTGSGKTTTLYSTLEILNEADTNILTIEDPVEYTIDGINQSQVHRAIGFDFPSALRSFLRQDPDVIMVGEIRDHETAELAIRASLTGHLVFSTIHANSAKATLKRLQDLGVEKYLLEDSIVLSIAQRLVRKLCLDCRTEDKRVREQFKNPNKKVYQAVGCNSCFNTGYKGRIALFEVLNHNHLFKGLLGDSSLTKSALKIWEDGLTSYEEILPILLSQKD